MTLSLRVLRRQVAQSELSSREIVDKKNQLWSTQIVLNSSLRSRFVNLMVDIL